MCLSEQRVPKFIRNTNGCEVLSNDGEMKLVLTRTVALTERVASEFFSVVYYIKEDDGWLKTNTTKTFSDIEEFICEIGRTEEFS